MEVARADPRKASRTNAHRPSARCTDAKRKGREKRQSRSPDAPVLGAYFTPPRASDRAWLPVWGVEITRSGGDGSGPSQGIRKARLWPLGTPEKV